MSMLCGRVRGVVSGRVHARNLVLHVEQKCTPVGNRVLNPCRTLITVSQKETELSSATTVANDEIDLSFETGRIAHLTDSAIIGRSGPGGVILVTCVSGPKKLGGFLPLMVDVRERYFSAGMVPTTFMRREMGITDTEILQSRLIDRSLRPMFPKTYFHDTQITATILSQTEDDDLAVLGINTASAAVCAAGIPFAGPVGAVRVGIGPEEEILVSPSLKELETCTLNLLYVGSESGAVMLEAEGSEAPEAAFKRALLAAQREVQPILDTQRALQDAVGRDLETHYTGSRKIIHEKMPEGLLAHAEATGKQQATAVFQNFQQTKSQRGAATAEVKTLVEAAIQENFPDLPDGMASLAVTECLRKVGVRDRPKRTC